MGGIFINYRNSAPQDVVSGMYRQLADHFGEEQVFRAKDSIRPGHTYWRVIKKRLRHCEVLLAVIHEEWLTEADASGTRLLLRERDWVRREIEIALRLGLKIIPVLVGDARRLTDHEPGLLPPSIREIRGNQGPRVRSASREADVAGLIRQLDRDVSATWTPSDAGTEQPWRPGRWLAYLTGLLALVVLAGPAVLVRHDAPAEEGESPPLLPVALQSIAIMLAVPVVFSIVHFGFGKAVESSEREAHRAPARRYNVVIMPAVLVFMAVLIYLGLATGTDELGMLLLFSGLFIGALRAAVIALRGERVDRELDLGWPHHLGPRPLPPALRRAVTRLEERLTQWRRPLSREQAAKATFMLGQLTKAAGTLREPTTRRRWLLAEHRWGLCWYTLWISTTVGLVVASAVPEVRAGSGSLGGWILIVVVFTLTCVAIAALTVEVGYRQHRRRQTVLAEEVADGVRRLGKRLAVLLEPPPWELPGNE